MKLNQQHFDGLMSLIGEEIARAISSQMPSDSDNDNDTPTVILNADPEDDDSSGGAPLTMQAFKYRETPTPLNPNPQWHLTAADIRVHGLPLEVETVTVCDIDVDFATELAQDSVRLDWLLEMLFAAPTERNKTRVSHLGFARSLGMSPREAIDVAITVGM